MEKAAYVREMFAAIAPRYDRTNRVISAGLDERWRRCAVNQLGLRPGQEILDLCCGTGDLIFHLLRRDRSLRVTGVDFCEPMLALARRRALRESRGAQPRFIEADVMQLPFPDRSFDGATMGFSLRNVVDIPATLREIRRLLRPGARFVNLEMSKAPNPLFKRAFDLYFYRIVPLVGGLVSGSRSAYHYLPESLTHFPDAVRLQALFDAAGFVQTRFLRLMGGSVAVHVGTAA